MENNKRIRFAFEGVVPFICIALVVLVIGLSVFYHGMRMNDANTVTTECEVVDKYQDHSGRMDLYYVVFSFASENGNFEKAINVAEETYWIGLNIGDRVWCEVVYDGIGIIDIAVLDERIEQHTAKDQLKEFFIGLGIAVGSFAVILGPIVYVCCKKDTEDAERAVSKVEGFEVDKRFLTRYRVTLQPEQGEDDEPRDLIIIETSGRDPDDAKEAARYWLDSDIDFVVVNVSEIHDED